ncbi:copper transport protein ATOX1 [Phalacrocorax aristotelis]|uniref:copper transport protein ATOX1 n=1 Tax=Phalacrocorax aristotelis TaxID=126867 RepID=UPI003F4BFCC5
MGLDMKAAGMLLSGEVTERGAGALPARGGRATSAPRLPLAREGASPEPVRSRRGHCEAAAVSAAPGALYGAGTQSPAWPPSSPARCGPPLPPHREPGAAAAAMPKHEFFVDMTCEGCSNAVTRVLHRLGGVQFDIDLPNKKVCIDSEHNVDTLLETLKKTGKNASYLGEKSAQ